MQLVYYEMTNDVRAAIAREKQIKGWLRAKKKALIDSFNPSWRDLSDEVPPAEASEAGPEKKSRDTGTRARLEVGDSSRNTPQGGVVPEAARTRGCAQNDKHQRSSAAIDRDLQCDHD